MPDNHFDDQFVENAWEKMLQMLDQEMPVQSRRRWGMIWWVLPFLLLIGAGGAWWVWSQQNTPTTASPKEKLAQPARPIAGKPIDPKDSKVNKDIVEPPIANGTASLQTKNSSAHVLTKHNNTSIDQQTSSNSIAASTFKHEKGTATSIPELTSENNQNITSSSLKVNTNPASPVEIAISDALSTTEKNEYPDFSLENLNPKTITALTEPKKNLDFSIQPRRHSITWRWGVEAGVLSNALAAVDGYTAGSIFDFPIRGRRFSLRTGLSYRFENQKIEYNSKKQLVESTPITGFTPNSNANQNFSNLSMHTQQLTLPVLAVYQPYRHWGIEGGVLGAYLIKANQLKGLENYPQTIANGSQSLDTSLDKFVRSFVYGAANQDIKQSELNHWQVAATLGLNYYPTDKWDIRLQYQYGINDWVKNSDFQSRIRSFQLSVVHYFR